MLDRLDPAFVATDARQRTDGLSPASLSTSPPTHAGWENAVRKSGPFEDHSFLKSDHSWSDVDMDGLARFLKDRHPDKTAVHTADAVGVPEATVKKWLLKLARPNGLGVLRLACAYGPEVLVAMLPAAPNWLRFAAREAEQARMEARMAALRAQIERAA